MLTPILHYFSLFCLLQLWMTSATNSRLVKSFFLSEHYCLVYENGDVFADVYLSLPPILQTHCFSAQSLQSHLTWRPFVTLSPFSTFVPNLPWKKMKTKWFYALALSAVIDGYWGLISRSEVYQDSYQGLRCLSIAIWWEASFKVDVGHW